jgi:hypothetical protein
VPSGRLRTRPERLETLALDGRGIGRSGANGVDQPTGADPWTNGGFAPLHRSECPNGGEGQLRDFAHEAAQLIRALHRFSSQVTVTGTSVPSDTLPLSYLRMAVVMQLN